MFDRIRTAWNYTSQTWSEDPAARGAAKMSAGGLLVADAVFNIRGRIGQRVRGRGRRASNNKPTGIVGSFIAVFIGLVIMLVGLFVVRPTWTDAAVTTSGEIVDVEERVRETDDGIERTYAGVVTFTDEAGDEHTFVQQVATGSAPSIGSTVEVTYEPTNPSGTAMRTDGWHGRVHWAVIGGGALMFVVAGVDFTVRAIMISVGVWLFMAGRGDRAAAGQETKGFFSDLGRLVWDSKRRQDAGDTSLAPGDGALAGLYGDEAAGGAPEDAGSDPPPPPPPAEPASGPPPGWYDSPGDGPGVLRWWDGSAWTEQTQTRPPPQQPPPPS